MDPEEKLAGLLEKYRKNRRFVPLEVLKTRYAESYKKLRAEIKCEILKCAICTPPWIANLGRFQDTESAARQISDLFLEIFRDGGYGALIRRAAFRDSDTDEVIRIARELRDKFLEALERYADRSTCLFAPESCWDPEDPQQPIIANLCRWKVWDDTAGEWRDPRHGELDGPAFVILIKGG